MLALEVCQDGIWDWTVASGQLWLSPRWEALLGYRPGELPQTRSSWSGRVHPDDLPAALAALEDHLAGRTPGYASEHRIRAKDGSWVWVLDRGRVVARGQEGRALRMVGTLAVLTERRRVEEALADSRMQLDAVLANAPVGVLLVDDDRRIASANAAIVRTFQLDMDRLVGASVRVVYGDDAVYEDIGRRAYPILHEGGTFDEEIPMRRADGTGIWCRIVGRQLKPDDPSRGSVWVIEDVTVRRRAEQTLSDRAGFQRVLLDTVPVPIFVQDVMGHYVDANTAFERWMGIDRQSLFGKTVFDLAPPELADTYMAADRALLADGKPQAYETQMHCADGTVRDVMFSKAAYCRTGGKPAGIVGAVTDISERKHAEQALRERQELFEQIFVASRAIKLLIDPTSGAIVDANPAAARFYGYPLDRLRTMHIDEINTLSPEAIAAEMEAARQARRQHFLFPHRIASGEIRNVEVYSSRVQVHGRQMLLSLVHDITERTRAEQALQRKTRELERSNAELEAFAYVASHDLRQPLRVVSNYLSLLERSLKDLLDDETREFIGFARDGALRMDRLIVDLLEYSRVGRKAQPFAPVSLSETVDNALFNLEMAIGDAGAEIRVERPLPTVAGDDNELERLFQNLIGNAVKYRLPDRPSLVTITCAEHEEGWRIDVTDNGIGIAEEHRERVFGIFQRLHRRDEYEGTGVGLAVCKKIVEHHGGRIWVEAAPGGGSRFSLTLPPLADRLPGAAAGEPGTGA